VLLARVDHEQRAGELVHLADAAQVLLQLIALGEQARHFLLGKHVELALGLHAVDRVQAIHAGADGAEIGERAAQPAVVHIVHAAALGFGFDGFLRLLFGAHEQDVLALEGHVAHEEIRLVDLLNGLLQVDDVDRIALGEDVLRHLRVPATGLVAKMHARFKQLLHGNDCHWCSSLFFPPSASPLPGTHKATPRKSAEVRFPINYSIPSQSLPTHFALNLFL